LLQDQVARLNLAASLAEEHPAEGQHEQDDSPHQEQPQGSVEENNSEELNQEAPEEEQEPENPRAENSASVLDPVPDGSINTSSQKAEELLDSSADDAPYELEYPELPEDDETEENLDADGIHENVDTAAPAAQVDEEFTEYEQYTEPREDDEDEEKEYGENLLEGGVEVVEPQAEQDSLETQQDDFVLVGSSTTDSAFESGNDATQYTGNEHDQDSNHKVSKSDSQSGVPDQLVSQSEPATSGALDGASISNGHGTDYTADDTIERRLDDIVHLDHEVSSNEERWDDSNLDAEGEFDTWDLDASAEHETASNQSSVTLSSKASKRSFHELDEEEAEDGPTSPPGSPGTKRLRVE